MLKQLSGRHQDIIRRLMCGETPGEICSEFGISASYLSVLQNDPLFIEEMDRMQNRVDDIFITSRQKAMEVLEAAALPAAHMARDAIVDGFIGGQDSRQEVPVKARLDSAWDVLKATGNVKPERKIVAHVTLADMIASAYAAKHKPKDEPEDEPKNVTPEPEPMSPEPMSPLLLSEATTQ